ncbi:MAG: HAMP domain-containing histidine kinase, partial [Lentisphaeraceae bacterium]|nr:HAMP domain-containing histidine kinase [Lentisphaeraceae bacterium]
KAKGKAEIAVETQKAFLTNISHAIRTPMNGILGMSEILKKSSLSDEQQDNLKVIDKSSNHLLKIIEDLLQYSRLDAKDIELRVAELSPREVVECCLELLSSQAKSRNVNLVAQIKTEKSIKSDELRLNQILINLVGNAIKFSRDSDVTVEVTDYKEGNHDGILCRVIDQGVGIDQADHSQIFEPFVQVDNSSTREFQGAGLGLAITKKLCEKLGGGIVVESEVKKGSVFQFSVYNLKEDDA